MGGREKGRIYIYIHIQREREDGWIDPEMEMETGRRGDRDTPSCTGRRGDRGIDTKEESIRVIVNGDRDDRIDRRTDGRKVDCRGERTRATQEREMKRERATERQRER